MSHNSQSKEAPDLCPGFIATGDFRIVKPGEWYFSRETHQAEMAICTMVKQMILVKQ